jgi:dUTP pyrophosphatase
MLSIFRCVPNAIIPSYATASSACFDIHACLVEGVQIKSFVHFPPSPFGSSEHTRFFAVDSKGEIHLPAGTRALIPTGLKFDIADGHSVRLHPRSGLSFKHGLSLSNCEGVIDADYVDEVFVSVINLSACDITIRHGDRICQGELVKDSRCAILETHTEPAKKTTRNGGFGSTGV